MADLDKLEAADIKAIIWKHWNNKNGQTLEERFTSTADEIAQALARRDGLSDAHPTPADPRPDLLGALREARDDLQEVWRRLGEGTSVRAQKRRALECLDQALAKISAVMAGGEG